MKNYFLITFLISFTCFSQEKAHADILKNIDSIFSANRFTEKDFYPTGNKYSNYFNDRKSIDSNLYEYSKIPDDKSYIRLTIYIYIPI